MNLKLLLANITPIEDDAWNEFEDFFSEKTIKKNDVVWKAGDICKHLAFINKGLIRVYNNSDDKEFTTNFYSENNFFYDDYSFISQQPCTSYFEALEETTLTIIPRAAIYLLFDKYKSFERLGRMMVEHNHALLIEQYQNNKALSSREKYLKLISDQPSIIQRVPLKFIASYLDITPEYLSKLRKDMTLL